MRKHNASKLRCMLSSLC